MRAMLPVWTLSFGLMAVAPLSLSAQQGTLVGSVTDESGGALAAGVEIQILGGSEPRTAVTDAQGRYSVELPAGRYDLVVTETFGFRDERFDNVRVQAGETSTFDLELTPLAFQLPDLNVTVGTGPLDRGAAGPVDPRYS